MWWSIDRSAPPPCPLASRSLAQAHLATRAVVSRATGDDDADDCAVAAGAGLALAGVNEELVLHRALLTATAAVVADRGAAPRDSRFQRGDDGVPQRLPVLGLHRPRRRERVQAGAEERLVGVDVA